MGSTSWGLELHGAWKKHVGWGAMETLLVGAILRPT